MVTIGQSLGMVSERLGAGPATLSMTVFGRWDELVGETMAAHVRPLRIDGRTLIVVADHQAWAYQVRRLSGELLSQVAAICDPAVAPERLEVRVRRPEAGSW